MTSCKKDTPRFINVESQDITRYVIDLSGNKINAYSKYLNDRLQQTVTFIDQDTIIERITKNRFDVIIGIEICYIGDDGFADSSINSCFRDNGILCSYNASTYQYNNGFLTEATVNYKFYGTYPDSGVVIITNNVSSENIISSGVSFGCTDYYDYNDETNVIDVRSFSNMIKGKISQNLISHASWNNGCPAGPSMSIAYSDFEYEFNSNNYIAKMKETYTPCYHTFDTEEVARTIRTTIYEYN
jgi:hypothetical protein